MITIESRVCPEKGEWVKIAPPKSHLESVELSELLDLFGKQGGILLGSYLDCNWSLIAITIILHGSSKWKWWIPSLFHRPKQWIFEWKAFKMTLHNYIKFDPPQNGWHLNHLIIPKKTYVFHPAELPPQLLGFTEGLFDVDHGWTNIYFFGKRVVIFPGKNGVGISGQIDAPGSEKTTIFQSGWWVSQAPSILVGVKIILQKEPPFFKMVATTSRGWVLPEMKLSSHENKGNVRIYSTNPPENIGKKVPFFEATKVAVWKLTSQRLFSRQLGQFKVFFVAGNPVANRTVSCHPVGGIGGHPCETGGFETARW